MAPGTSIAPPPKHLIVSLGSLLKLQKFVPAVRETLFATLGSIHAATGPIPMAQEATLVPQGL